MTRRGMRIFTVSMALSTIVYSAQCLAAGEELTQPDPEFAQHCVEPATAGTGGSTPSPGRGLPDCQVGEHAVSEKSTPGPLVLAEEQSSSAAVAHGESPKGFWRRFAEAYGQQWREDAYTAPGPETGTPEVPHKLPSPFDSPPFPGSEWTLGGTPTIGSHNEGNAYGTISPLTEALQSGPNGQWWKDNKINIYGWVDFGANSSSSSTRAPPSLSPSRSEVPQSQPQGSAGGNFPSGYDIRPNYVELNQFVLRFERVPDEYKSQFDWGFRFDTLYGLDYRFTTMNGVVSDQLLKYNQIYGVDFPMAYVDLWYPNWGPGGTNLRIGRYAALQDIESVYAPDNLMFTHSLSNTFDCYTQVGAVATTKINNQWKILYGINAGCDTAPWVSDAKPTGQFCAQWISESNKDSLYPCFTALNDAQWAYNNMNSFNNVWTHKFNETVYTSTEYWYMWEENVKSCALSPKPGCLSDPEVFAPGTSLSQQKRLADEQGVVNFTELRMSSQSFLSVRNEYFDDKAGQRTGFATRYWEHSVGMTYWPNKLVTIRPEVRYEYSLDKAAYNFGKFSSTDANGNFNGGSSHQFTAAIDCILRY